MIVYKIKQAKKMKKLNVKNDNWFSIFIFMHCGLYVWIAKIIDADMLW